MNIINTITKSSKGLLVHVSKKKKTQFLYIIVFTIFIGIMEILSIASLLPFVNSVTDINYFNKNYQALTSFFENRERAIIGTGLLFASLSLIVACSKCLHIYLTARFSHETTAEIAFQIYKAKLNDSYINYISKNSSVVIASITQKVVQISTTFTSIINFISYIFLFLSIASVLIWVNPKIMIIIILFFLFLYSTLIVLGKKTLRRNGEIINKAQNKIVDSLRNGLSAIRNIIIDNTKDFYLNIFKKAFDEKTKRLVLSEFIWHFPRYIFEGFAIITAVVVVIFLAKFQGDENNFFIILPTLAVFALGAQKIIPLINSIYVNLSIIRSGVSQVSQVLEILDEDLIKNNEKEMIHRKKINFTNSILFENISFFYNKNQEYILENINFEIKKGSRIGIIGKTGEGKSTFLDLIMGLLSPATGEIKIDGIKLNKETIDSWQSKIAHVPQNIFLSDGSFFENIAFGIDPKKINIEKVKLAAQKSQSHNFIMKLERGYEQMVGERGVKLSGGQIQRIGLARAMYKNAEVVIFDEATNALDYDTEKLIINELNQLDRNLTVIIVAHRLNTLNICDLIYEIKNKKIYKIKNRF